VVGLTEGAWTGFGYDGLTAVDISFGFSTGFDGTGSYVVEGFC
jgi:hypothetical protein